MIIIEHPAELQRPGMPLGRHIEHDPRSLAYAEPDTGAGTYISKTWERNTPILDQGNVGSCTGNATVGVLGSGIFYDALAQLMPMFGFSEADALALYSLAEQIDGGKGLPSEDQGSTGLSVAKAAVESKLISGYTHILSFGAAQTAIAKSPFITGTVWLQNMFTPDSRGLVVPAGKVAGGHEYEVLGHDVANGVWEFCNSWGTGWGVNGHFFMRDEDYSALLADQGDATVFAPLTSPAPLPTPTPPVGDLDAQLWATIGPWAKGSHSGATRSVANTIKNWAKDKGFS